MFKLHLRNFRGFENETFDFKKINLLIGENSSGKSSIFKFLLMLKQSFENSTSFEDFNLELNGKYVEMGEYEDIIYNHEIERNLYFAIEVPVIGRYNFEINRNLNLNFSFTENEKYFKRLIDNIIIEGKYIKLYKNHHVFNYIKIVIFESIKYINTLQDITKNRYYHTRKVPKKHFEPTIEGLVYLLNGKSVLKGEELEQFKEKYLKILTEFGIVESVRLGVNADDSLQELKVQLGGLEANIDDVGYGVGLQLPTIAAALLAKKDDMLFIEQPEVHLHPSLQAKFMEALMKAGNQSIYFIETHSEHILRKLQVLVKQQKYGLRSEDVNILYFKKQGIQMTKVVHQIDQATGKLLPKLPSGFYDVSSNLAYDLID